MNQSIDAMSNVKQLSSEGDIDFAQVDTLQCPICAFTTSNRSKFTEHLINYCTSKRNDSIFKANLSQSSALKYLQGNDKCSPTVGEECTGHETEEIDESSLYVSRMNSQNGVKKQDCRNFRENKSCKQCSFVTNTKMEYWEHMRCHIKGFTCSECSFVTKYKHHMNHHWLSVHDGSKPFKCKKCSYTCVSKSMLTSHLKKHSNVYPYRCANCTYKTKFCNALKKHLRKKEHQPAMVLNADGSPNPLFIIDVYGTKRGPKQKLSADKQDELNHNANIIANNNQLGSAITSPVLSLQSPVTRYLTMTTMNGMNDANLINQNSKNQSQSIATFPYNDLIAAFNLSSHLLLHEDTTFNENIQKPCDRAQSNTSMNVGNRMMETFVQNPSVTFLDTNDTNEYRIFEKDTKAISEPSALVALKSQLDTTQKNEFIDTPLDLRIAEVMKKNQLQFQLLATNSSKITGTSKRKGKAIKFERRVVEKDADKKPERNEVESLELSVFDKSNIQKENQKMKDTEGKTAANSVDTEFICHYCEIIFGNVVMYTVHMGCHGFDDPFTCNMCGHQCTDKLSFFLHIARSEHM